MSPGDSNDVVYLEAVESLRSLLSSLASGSLKETNRIFKHDDVTPASGDGDINDGAYGWASWTCGPLLTILSICPLQDRHRISGCSVDMSKLMK